MSPKLLIKGTELLFGCSEKAELRKARSSLASAPEVVGKNKMMVGAFSGNNSRCAILRAKSIICVCVCVW